MAIFDFLSKPLAPSEDEPMEDTGRSEFLDWYPKKAGREDAPSDPDDPRQYYDFRGAYESGAKLDKNKHLPSKFKHDLHPDRYSVDEKDLSIYDTKYDKPAKFEDLIIQSFKRKDYEESIWRK